MNKPVCVVVGAGPGNGAAIARRFSQEGYRVALMARSTEFSEKLATELGDARAIACDASDASAVATAFAEARSALGEVNAVVYNAGSGAWGNIEELSAADFEANWRVNALGAFLVAQEVIPAMKRAGAGSFIFIGATASWRGIASTAAFAPAKAAQRSLAQSMAKYLGPAGIHVALVIIDGVVDLPRTRARMPDKDDDFFVKPAAVADTVFHLTIQDRSAWSFEVEARPFAEVWH